MKLRIVAGSLKGRMLSLPLRDTDFRPTLERTRRSVADMLQSRLPGAFAADLCAGSGAFGFEMVSRGAARVDFVENDRWRSESIRNAAERFGVANQCGVFTQNVGDFLRQSANRYDIIFYDPPYDDRGLGKAMLPALLNRLSTKGILVFQCKKAKGATAIAVQGVTPFAIRNFGDTIVEVYRSAEANNE
jgi:16S rRNA (guanine966-N2)-methyltransferase